MNFNRSVLVILAVALAPSFASAAEAVWPKGSASELSAFATLQRFRIYADHCSANVPQLKPAFDALIQRLASRIQDISKNIVDSDEFKDMPDEPVPAEIIHALKDSFDDLKHNFERRDAALICPKTLQDLGEVNDESLKSGLMDILTGVQNMIRNLDRNGAGQASPSRLSRRVVQQ